MESPKMTTVGNRTYYYRDFSVDPDGRRKRIYAASEGELQFKLDRIEKARERMREGAIPNKKECLNVFVSFYFRNYAKRDVVSISTYMLIKRAIYNSPLDIPIMYISKEILEKYLSKLTLLYTLEKVKNVAETLHDMFVALKADDAVALFPLEIKDLNPNIGITTKSYRYILRSNEYNELLEFCLDSTLTLGYGDNLDIIILGMFTGFPLCVVYEIKVSDLDFDGRQIMVNYNNELYTSPMPERFVEYFEEFKIRSPERFAKKDIPEYLFRKDGEFPSLASVNETLLNLTARIGLPDGITPKCLQKSYIIKELKCKTSDLQSLCDRLNIQRTKILEFVNEYKLKFS